MTVISIHNRSIEKIDCSLQSNSDAFWLNIEAKNKDGYVLDEITFFNTKEQLIKLAEDMIRTLTESINAIDE